MKSYDEQFPIDRITRPILIFSKHKLAGAGLLLLATLVALVIANSAGNDKYFSILATEFVIGFGEYQLAKPILLWINDGLMGIFFFVVGLEIKRELLIGELSDIKKAMLPISAAIGGMAIPALVYAFFNYNLDSSHGWGIPMATDIAFALGVLALFNVPIGLKVFLTALAIVDDVGAIIVIAVFYTESIAVSSLLIGGMFLFLSILANWSGVRNPIIYFLIGSIVWLAFLKSGVHATLASVLMAMTIPARSIIDGEAFTDKTSELLAVLKATGLPKGDAMLSNEQHNVLHSIQNITEDAMAPLQELEHAIVPYVSFLILPVFALANAGVEINVGLVEAIKHPITLGIVFGLFIGKPLGILVFTWIAVRTGIAVMPKKVNWLHISAVGVIAGIGFTMSLFISSLAFVRPEFVELSKIGILAGSSISFLVGSFLLYMATRK